MQKGPLSFVQILIKFESITSFNPAQKNDFKHVLNLL